MDPGRPPQRYSRYCPNCQRFRVPGQHVCPGPPGREANGSGARRQRLAREARVASRAEEARGALSALGPRAVSALGAILAGRAIGDARPPTIAEILRAAELVLARVAPVAASGARGGAAIAIAATLALSPSREREIRLALGLGAPEDAGRVPQPVVIEGGVAGDGGDGASGEANEISGVRGDGT